MERSEAPQPDFKKGLLIGNLAGGATGLLGVGLVAMPGVGASTIIYLKF